MIEGSGAGSVTRISGSGSGSATLTPTLRRCQNSKILVNERYQYLTAYLQQHFDVSDFVVQCIIGNRNVKDFCVFFRYKIGKSLPTYITRCPVDLKNPSYNPVTIPVDFRSNVKEGRSVN